MQRTFLLIAILVFGCITLAWGDDFQGFRIPANRTYDGSASVNGWYNPRSDHTMGAHHVYTESSVNGNVQGSWMWDSERRYRRFSAYVSGSLQQYNGENLTEPGFASDDRRESLTDAQNVNERGSINGTWREYPWTTPVGVEISGSLEANFRQLWSHAESETEHYWEPIQRNMQWSDQEQWDYSYNTSLHGTFGYGRVRNATGVFTVYVLEQRLTEAGLLAKPLSPAARQQLAELFYISGDYSAAHDRSTRFFWRDVEKILAQDGALAPGGLDAYGTYRAGESYAASLEMRFGSYRSYSYSYFSSVYRQTGWFAGLMVDGSHVHQLNRYDSFNRNELYVNDSLTNVDDHRTGSIGDSWRDDLSLGVRGEYHRPLSMAWQFDAAGAVSFPTDYPEKGMSLSGSANLYYIIADRWLARGMVEHTRSYGENRDANAESEWNDWNVRFGAGLSYYVEDNLTLTVSATQEQDFEKPSLSSSSAVPHLFSRFSYVSIGITYNLFGGFAAPGLGLAEHLLGRN